MYKRIKKKKKPEGYAFKGLDDINIDIRYNDDEGNPSIGFVSDYVLKEDHLTISITEYYNDSQYPVARFEEFRKVINAAADFNKVVLVLEKN